MQPGIKAIVATAAMLGTVSAGWGAQADKAAALPDGPGKENVEAVCTACHQTREIHNSSGYTREGWKELFGTMVDLSAAPEVQDRITQPFTIFYARPFVVSPPEVLARRCR